MSTTGKRAGRDIGTVLIEERRFGRSADVAAHADAGPEVYECGFESAWAVQRRRALPCHPLEPLIRLMANRFTEATDIAGGSRRAVLEKGQQHETNPITGTAIPGAWRRGHRGVLAVGTGAAVHAAPSARSVPAAASCAPGTDVTTSTGPICGIVVNGVSEWQGIPYAAPPVGPLRWPRRSRRTPWTATLPPPHSATRAYRPAGVLAVRRE